MSTFCMLQRRKNNLEFSIRILYENTQEKQNSHQLPDKCNKILHTHTHVHTQQTVEQLKILVHSLTQTLLQTTACTLCRFKAESISHVSMCVRVCVCVHVHLCSLSLNKS